MSLENLVAIRRLSRLDATPDSIRKLLVAAERNLADAQATNISAENRFDAAYKAIMQCAMAGLSQIVHWNAGGLGRRGRADLRSRDEPITVSIGEERGRKSAARRPQAAA